LVASDCNQDSDVFINQKSSRLAFLKVPSWIGKSTPSLQRIKDKMSHPDDSEAHTKISIDKPLKTNAINTYKGIRLTNFIIKHTRNNS